jgi:hypothetical protein
VPLRPSRPILFSPTTLQRGHAGADTPHALVHVRVHRSPAWRAFQEGTK